MFRDLPRYAARCCAVTRQFKLRAQLLARFAFINLAFLLFSPAGWAQTIPTPATPPIQDSSAFSVAFDAALKLNADRTAEYLETRRIKVLGVAALQQLSQQTVSYEEGRQRLEIVAAFTEKPGGRHVPVDPATVITRDGAAGLAAVYLRDLKALTLIFPDVAVGDTLVLQIRRTILADNFAGHFQTFVSLSRTIPYADSTWRVIAPSSVPLKVAVQGAGLEMASRTEGGETQHTITYRSQPVIHAEDRMTSALDHDPRISISTFASYEELASSYWGTARAAMDVTPEISNLAEEITRGVNQKRTSFQSEKEFKRAEARAISTWVKTNVRYVNVVLGNGRVVPRQANVVLKDRYGDCKDHVVLMSALLAAKGIASEHALINAGNSYTLLEPPTLGNLNHVILYLPEFGLYDDPTAQFASFGVLSDVEYDKPVAHASDHGAHLARTPAMKPEDHVSTRHTEIAVAADGAMSGTSRQSGTGVFATAIRTLAAAMQVNGPQRTAEELLRRAGAPGKGTFDIPPFGDIENSYSVRSTFSFDARLNLKQPARYFIPNGLGIQARPGDQLLGTRIPARKLPFTCLAGTQIEEIDLTFADGLPLPQKIDGRRIETKSFTYTADYRLEGRILKARREFRSRIPGQVCPPEIETEIAQPARDVAASNAAVMIFGARPTAPPPGQSSAAPAPPPPVAPASPATSEINRVGTVDRPLPIDFLAALNPDCSPISIAGVRTVEAPKNGKLTIEKTEGFTSFPADNPRSACNRRRSEGTKLSYQPERGYIGTDSLAIDVIYGDGGSRRRHYAITINSKPIPIEMNRVAATEQQARIAFLTDLEPDCSSQPFAGVRIIEPPKHGEATVKPDTGFTNFAKDNARFECNKQRSDGTGVFYRSASGYTGADSLLVEITYPDGRLANARYSIEVK